MLFERCRSINPFTYQISDPEEIDLQWFKGINSIGITGATSTPAHLLDIMARKMISLFPEAELVK
jgi:4-hydroxy-3-methylbut-2-enyl diphosphate reductase